MTSQMCFIGLRPDKLGGQDINWNSSLCSSNHFNTIQSLQHWSCLAGRFHFQLIRQMLYKDVNDSQLCSGRPQLSWSVFTTTKSLRATHESVFQSIILLYSFWKYSFWVLRPLQIVVYQICLDQQPFPPLTRKMCMNDSLPLITCPSHHLIHVILIYVIS